MDTEMNGNNKAAAFETVEESMPDVEWIRNKITASLSPKRYAHSLEVAQNAKIIAKKTSADPEKMYIAGLLHDIAKELSNEEMLKLCERAEKYITVHEKKNIHLLHGMAGACIAYDEYGIRDKEILMAIAFHSGRVDMQTAEKIVFLADVISNCKKYGYDAASIWQKESLDEALAVACGMMTQYCVEHGIQLDERTRDSYDYIIEHLGETAEKTDIDTQNIRMQTDNMFDTAMQIYLSHRLNIDSVKNIRDIGGYETASGKKIRKGMLIRSGELSHLTKEDTIVLKEYGVNTVIDLRTKEEIENAPNLQMDNFSYYNCPLPTLNITNRQKYFADRVAKSATEREAAWYASEYLRYIDMKNMYKDILSMPDSIPQLRRVFLILLDPDTKGVLFHCVSGKDRTGIVAMLIQSVLGMNSEEITKDYYASALPHYAIAEDAAMMMENQGYDSTKTRELFSIEANMITEIKRFLEGNQEGFAEEYVTKKIMINQEQIQALRRKYLEDDTAGTPKPVASVI